MTILSGGEGGDAIGTGILGHVVQKLDCTQAEVVLSFWPLGRLTGWCSIRVGRTAEAAPTAAQISDEQEQPPPTPQGFG